MFKNIKKIMPKKNFFFNRRKKFQIWREKILQNGRKFCKMEENFRILNFHQIITLLETRIFFGMIEKLSNR